MPKGKRHGNLSKKASRVYEALRRKGKHSKKSAAKLANWVVNRKKKGKKK